MKTITPKAGQLLAVISNGFVPESIRFFEKIQEIREGEYSKNELIINHIAGIITDKDGDLAVCEMDAPGCVITKWIKSRYYKNECKFLLLDFVVTLTPDEVLRLSIMGRNDEGKLKYDFMGIGSQIVQTLFGWWLGLKGKSAEKRMYCSEQWATYLNRVKGWFKHPYKWNPQMFFENDIIKIVGANFEYKIINA